MFRFWPYGVRASVSDFRGNQSTCCCHVRADGRSPLPEGIPPTPPSEEAAAVLAALPEPPLNRSDASQSYRSRVISFEVSLVEVLVFKVTRVHTLLAIQFTSTSQTLLLKPTMSMLNLGTRAPTPSECADKVSIQLTICASCARCSWKQFQQRHTWIDHCFPSPLSHLSHHYPHAICHRQ